MDPWRLGARLIAEAHTWLQTPWHHNARVRGAGVDCGQFLIACYAGAGLIPDVDTGPYHGVDPGPTHAPVIFQPPVELSGVPQVWIGAAGGDHWGGAQVWVSNDDATYTRAGTITAPARYGVLTGRTRTPCSRCSWT